MNTDEFWSCDLQQLLFHTKGKSNFLLPNLPATFSSSAFDRHLEEKDSLLESADNVVVFVSGGLASVATLYHLLHRRIRQLIVVNVMFIEANPQNSLYSTIIDNQVALYSLLSQMQYDDRLLNVVVQTVHIPRNLSAQVLHLFAIKEAVQRNNLPLQSSTVFVFGHAPFPHALFYASTAGISCVNWFSQTDYTAPQLTLLLAEQNALQQHDVSLGPNISALVYECSKHDNTQRAKRIQEHTNRQNSYAPYMRLCGFGNDNKCDQCCKWLEAFESARQRHPQLVSLHSVFNLRQ